MYVAVEITIEPGSVIRIGDWIRECSSASFGQFRWSSSPSNAPHMKLIRVSAHGGRARLLAVHPLHGSESIYCEGRGALRPIWSGWLVRNYAGIRALCRQ